MPLTSLQQQITISALPSKVWKVLTTTYYVNQYLFCENICSDWTEGSLVWLPGAKENSERVKIGQVLQCIPGIILKFSLKEIKDSEEMVLTYELMLSGEGVELKIKCEGFIATGQEYLLREHSAKIILKKIKFLAEYS